jgi:hypothetical protein
MASCVVFIAAPGQAAPSVEGQLAKNGPAWIKNTYGIVEKTVITTDVKKIEPPKASSDGLLFEGKDLWINIGERATYAQNLVARVTFNTVVTEGTTLKGNCTVKENLTLYGYESDFKFLVRSNGTWELTPTGLKLDWVSNSGAYSSYGPKHANVIRPTTVIRVLHSGGIRSSLTIT